MTDALNAAGSGAMEGGQGGMPKASIGSFKGVMLCNRPDENGQQARPEPAGPTPFRSRVDPKSQNPLGWNPCQRVFPKSSKKKSLFSGVLSRHKAFIQNLEMHKKLEREEQAMLTEMNDKKFNKFKEQAGKQRLKIKQLKDTEDQFPDEGAQDVQQPVEQQLDEYLGANEDVPSQRPSQQSKKSSKKGKPAWATTQKQQEEQKEMEIDDLLEFAYELDYDKYMEDQEIKLAFEIIKERVGDIKKDQDWKEQMAKEWNDEVEQQGQIPMDSASQMRARQQRDADRQSVYSYRSTKSKTSYMKQVKDAKKAEKDKSEWDRTTIASDVPRTLEEKVASRIANEMLKENPQLKGIHSNLSLKKILEKEAKRQLLDETGGHYQAPIISKVPTHQRNTRTDPSNLPYLHKCPAV